MDVSLTTVTAVAAVPPRLTVAPLRKPVPVIISAVPPSVGPELGAIVLTVGAGFENVGAALNATICITQGAVLSRGVQAL
jgi:hypothetical protein